MLYHVIFSFQLESKDLLLRKTKGASNPVPAWTFNWDWIDSESRISSAKTYVLGGLFRDVMIN